MSKSQKGSKFEREVCKNLSYWWSYKKYDDVFWRTSQSGGRATQRMKKGMRTHDSYGDVGSMRSLGKPLTMNNVIEIKRGYTSKKGRRGKQFVSLLDIVDAPDGRIEPVIIQWWKKLMKEVRKSKRVYGFIIFKRDRCEPCIMMLPDSFGYLFGPGHEPFKYSITSSRYHTVITMLLTDFFRLVDPRKLGAKKINYFKRDCRKKKRRKITRR